MSNEAFHGHAFTSEATAYVVNDYPYGSMRCRIRYWLEKHPKRGFRFVSQTENPKTLRWNAPKKSTYSPLAGCMYLDDKGHVTWDGVNEYTEGQKVIEFLTRFPLADVSLLLDWTAKKVRFYELLVADKLQFTVNGEPRPRSDEDKRKDRENLDAWREAYKLARVCSKHPDCVALGDAVRIACGR